MSREDDDDFGEGEDRSEAIGNIGQDGFPISTMGPSMAGKLQAHANPLQLKLAEQKRKVRFQSDWHNRKSF
jgi:hypothetical protein